MRPSELISLAIRENIKTQYEIVDESLIPRIRYEFEESGERFATPAIALKLKEKGISVSKDHIRRLMKQEGLVSKQFRLRCRGNSTYRKFNFRSDKLKRNFTQEKLNRWTNHATLHTLSKTRWSFFNKSLYYWTLHATTHILFN